MPVTDQQWGVSTWVDYTDNWTSAYAAYVQRKGISRFQTAVARDAAIPSPYPGEVCYNQATDRLELRTNAGVWTKMSFLPQNLASWQDDAAGVAMGHALAGNKGVIFGPADVKITLPLNVMSGVTQVDATGLSIKTGATTVKVTTDAAGLALDKQVTAPTFVPTGAVGMDATGKEIKGNFTGGSIAGSTITAATSVSSPSVVVGTTNIASALMTGAVVRHQSAQMDGDSSKGYFRGVVPGTGAARVGVIEIDDNVVIKGTKVQFPNPVEVTNAAYPKWVFAGVANTISAHIIYSASDPGATNFPDGTIWVS